MLPGRRARQRGGVLPNLAPIAGEAARPEERSYLVVLGDEGGFFMPQRW